MAASSYTYPLHSFILTTILLLLARLATSTLLNPSIQPDITCFAPEMIQDKPAAVNCGGAIAGLPYSTDPTDYHRDPASGRFIYTTGLTSVGDPSSHLHLPQSSWSGDCRIDIRMSQHVQVANILWDDVRQTAYDLVERCVGNLRIVPSPSGPGGGGTAQLGSVLISIMYMRDTGRPGTAQVRPGTAPSRPGAGAGSGWNIGAHYPSAANA